MFKDKIESTKDSIGFVEHLQDMGYNLNWYHRWLFVAWSVVVIWVLLPIMNVGMKIEKNFR